MGGSLLDQRLEFLVGALHGPERMHATQWAPAGTAQGRVRGEVDVDGRVLLYPFDSVGHPPEAPAVGSWHGDDLVFERSSPRGSARTTYTPTADGYTWSKQFRSPDDDRWQPMIEAP